MACSSGQATRYLDPPMNHSQQISVLPTLLLVLLVLYLEHQRTNVINDTQTKIASIGPEQRRHKITHI